MALSGYVGQQAHCVWL